jgi:peptidoglycan/xylan/chitin deacetylase (PgdA/CDA1 family)
LRLHEAMADPHFMVILLFHRVTDAIPEDVLTVSTGRFRAICNLLRRRFNVVPLSEVFRTVREGSPIRRRTVAITFDDCYQDNLLAARVLADQGLPATFFVPTGYVSTEQAFAWDSNLPRLPNLSWEDLREMAGLGHEIGSHTVSHLNMGKASEPEARLELLASRAILEAQLGQPVRWFAYPFGGPEHIRPELFHLLQETGYQGAVSAHGGFIYPGSDHRLLPRVAVPSFRSLAHLEVFLSGCLNWWYDLRSRASTPAPLSKPIADLQPVQGAQPGPSSAGVRLV